MKRGKVAIVVVPIVVLAFFFFLPAIPSYLGSCYYRPDENGLASLSFQMLGWGATYSNGHFFLQLHYPPYCI